MTKLLKELLGVELMSKTDGDDERLDMIQSAANDIATKLTQEPALIMNAIITAINPCPSMKNAVMIIAKESMTKHWQTFETVYPDPTIDLYRALLFTACSNIASNNLDYAAIIWLIAVDMFPLFKVGAQEKPMRSVLIDLAQKLEENIFSASEIKKSKEPASLSKVKISDIPTLPSFEVNTKELLQKIAQATGGAEYYNKDIEGANPHYPNQNDLWIKEFTPKLCQLLTHELVVLSTKIKTDMNNSNQLLKENFDQLSQSIVNFDRQQRTLLTRRLNENKEILKVEQNKINALWWYEALYSSSFACSYRELEPEFACVTMTLDLLQQLSIPTTISTAYLLSEAIYRLPSVDTEKKYKITELLELIKDQNKFSDDILESMEVVPIEQKPACIRDLVVGVLFENDFDIEANLKEIGLTESAEITLPNFSRAIFRQEQAVRISRGL